VPTWPHGWYRAQNWSDRTTVHWASTFDMPKSRWPTRYSTDFEHRHSELHNKCIFTHDTLAEKYCIFYHIKFVTDTTVGRQAGAKAEHGKQLVRVVVLDDLADGRQSLLVLVDHLGVYVVQRVRFLRAAVRRRKIDCDRAIELCSAQNFTLYLKQQRKSISIRCMLQCLSSETFQLKHPQSYIFSNPPTT